MTESCSTVGETIMPIWVFIFGLLCVSSVVVMFSVMLFVTIRDYIRGE